MVTLPDSITDYTIPGKYMRTLFLYLAFHRVPDVLSIFSRRKCLLEIWSRISHCKCADTAYGVDAIDTASTTGEFIILTPGSARGWGLLTSVGVGYSSL